MKEKSNQLADMQNQVQTYVLITLIAVLSNAGSEGLNLEFKPVTGQAVINGIG